MRPVHRRERPEPPANQRIHETDVPPRWPRERGESDRLAGSILLTTVIGLYLALIAIVSAIAAGLTR